MQAWANASHKELPGSRQHSTSPKLVGNLPSHKKELISMYFHSDNHHRYSLHKAGVCLQSNGPFLFHICKYVVKLSSAGLIPDKAFST